MLAYQNNKKGISIIEILVAITIITIGLFSLFSLTNFSLKARSHNERNIMAVNLSSEMIEAVRIVRDENWNNISGLTMGVDYYPVQSGAAPDWQWVLQSGSESVLGGQYLRRVLFEDVSRDTNDDIEDVYNFANDDSNTKKVTAKVSWTEAGVSRQIEIVTYITNWR